MPRYATDAAERSGKVRVEDPYAGLGSGLHVHGGYVPHSHEVRPDHAGVRFSEAGLRSLDKEEGKATKKTETLYIAGPMRGLKDFNYPQFREVAKALRNLSYTVHCPAENFGGDSGREYSEYMAADIKMVLESDGLVLLPGWQKSEGAKLEVGVARALGLKFYEAFTVSGENVNIWRFRSASPTVAEGIDHEARRLVYGERAQTYGHPKGDFEMIGLLWSAITHTTVTAEMVAMMMICMKLARLRKTPTHRDSQVDVIGYALCLARLQEDPAEVAAWEARATE